MKNDKKKKRTAADVIQHPIDGPKSMQERIDYLNMPGVQRAMGIERAEKQEPIRDTPMVPRTRDKGHWKKKEE